MRFNTENTRGDITLVCIGRAARRGPYWGCGGVDEVGPGSFGGGASGSGGGVAAGDSALNFLPADTKVVIGIRVSAIRESALFKDAGTDARKLGDEWMKMVAITGFDPIHDIDEILIFSAAGNDKADALIAVRGGFNLERLGAAGKRSE